MYLCVGGIDLTYFYDFDIGFWKCSDIYIFSIWLIQFLNVFVAFRIRVFMFFSHFRLVFCWIMETFIITMTKYIVFLLFQSHRPIGILIVISMHAVYYLHSTCVSFCSNHFLRGRRGRDRMVVGFTTTCAISIYEH
jgi:hypothetical protein